jgi:hypothetical protein
MKLDAMLWAGILVSPIVWFLNLEANFALAPLACSGGGKPALYFVSVISLIVVAAAAGLSWVQWRSLEQEPAGQRARPLPPRRAMALGGAALSSLFFLVILAQAIPSLMMAGCE